MEWRVNIIGDLWLILNPKVIYLKGPIASILGGILTVGIEAKGVEKISEGLDPEDEDEEEEY